MDFNPTQILCHYSVEMQEQYWQLLLHLNLFFNMDHSIYSFQVFYVLYILNFGFTPVINSVLEKVVKSQKEVNSCLRVILKYLHQRRNQLARDFPNTKLLIDVEPTFVEMKLFATWSFFCKKNDVTVWCCAASKVLSVVYSFRLQLFLAKFLIGLVIKLEIGGPNARAQ